MTASDPLPTRDDAATPPRDGFPAIWAERVRRHSGALFSTFHPRYAIAYGASHLIPTFGGGTLIATMYRLAGFSIGAGTSFNGPLRLLSGIGFVDHLTIGRDTIISTDVTINLDERVAIGDRVAIGPYVRIYTGSHPIGPGSRRMLPQVVGKPVTIGSGAWLGLGAIVLPGTTIGEGSIVAAGSVVTADIPPHSYAEGNPARVVRSLPWSDR